MRSATRPYRQWLVVAAAAVAALLAQQAPAVPIPDQGTWIAVLLPRDVNGDGTVDAWYDTSTNLTWLASAQQEMTYADGVSYIAVLDAYGVTGWAWANQSQIVQMYYIDLGNVDSGAPGWRNTGPFIDLTDGSLSGWFWTGAPLRPVDGAPGLFTSTVFAADGTGVFSYDALSTSHLNVWAVRDGDIPVAAVPEPETWALMIAGLAVIVSTARQRRVTGKRRCKDVTRSRSIHLDVTPGLIGTRPSELSCTPLERRGAHGH